MLTASEPAAADCSSQIRLGNRVYTGYAFTDRATEFAIVERADCHDVGQDAEGSVYSDEAPQVTAWSFQGYSTTDVLGVRFDDDSFEVFFSESLSTTEVDRVADEMRNHNAQ